MLHKPITDKYDHLWQSSNRFCHCGQPVTVKTVKGFSCMHNTYYKGERDNLMPLFRTEPTHLCYWCHHKIEIKREERRRWLDMRRKMLLDPEDVEREAINGI